MNKDDNYRSKVEMILKKGSLSRAVEMEIVGASALMEAETLLDSKSADYTMGFLNGFDHCLKLGELFDVINNEKDKILLK
jgi:hypothetical protein